MTKTYLYMDHSGMEFYLSDRERTAEEMYCPLCESSDELIGIYEDEETFSVKLLELFTGGYDLLPCNNYNEIKEKYCPPELREWEKRDEDETKEDLCL